MFKIFHIYIYIYKIGEIASNDEKYIIIFILFNITRGYIIEAHSNSEITVETSTKTNLVPDEACVAFHSPASQ